MGCSASKEDGDYSTRKQRMMNKKNKNVMHRLVREYFDEDPEKHYEFCGPVVGEGGYAKVMFVRPKNRDMLCALKMIDISKLKESAPMMRLLENEIDVMKKLQHPNIVRLQEVFHVSSKDMIYLVLDRLEGGSLREKWKEANVLSEAETAHILHGTLSAVKYCHKRRIAHRDLKMDNIMFESQEPNSVVKVIDFGTSATFSGNILDHLVVGSRWYMAPEILKFAGHSIECDIWSIGVIAYALIGGLFPFFHPNPDVMDEQVQWSPLTFPSPDWDTVSEGAKDFITQCLEKNPKKRATASKLLTHPWLKKSRQQLNDGTAQDGQALLGKRTLVCLNNFRKKSTFERAAMELIAYTLDPDEIKEMEREFLALDTEGGGEITLEQFKNAFTESAGKYFSNEKTREKLMNDAHLQEVFESIDVDHTGTINFTEFCAACLGQRHVSDTNVRVAFEALDTQHRGSISKEAAVEYLGDDQAIESDFKAIDQDGDNQLDWGEFRRAMFASARRQSHMNLRKMSSGDSASSKRGLSRLGMSFYHGESFMEESTASSYTGNTPRTEDADDVKSFELDLDLTQATDVHAHNGATPMHELGSLTEEGVVNGEDLVTGTVPLTEMKVSKDPIA